MALPCDSTIRNSAHRPIVPPSVEVIKGQPWESVRECATRWQGMDCTSVYKEKNLTVAPKIVAFLITLAVSYGYSLPPVVCCIADKEAEKMRKTLEDLYYGNITPHAQDMTAGSELKQAVNRVAHYENQLTERLDEVGQEILTKLVRSQHEIDSITALENFILGFRLGARMIVECMDDNDGDIRNGGD